MKKYDITLPKINLTALLMLCCIVGIAVGTFLSFSVDESVLADMTSCSRLIAKASQGQWFSLFLRYFFVNASMLACAFVFGFGAFYQPLSFILLMIKGTELGLLTRGVYLTDDVLQSLGAYLPFALLNTALLVAQTKQSVELSNMYLSLTLTNENRLGLKNEAGDCFAKLCIYLLLAAIVAALRCLVICLLAG